MNKHNLFLRDDLSFLISSSNDEGFDIVWRISKSNSISLLSAEFWQHLNKKRLNIFLKRKIYI